MQADITMGRSRGNRSYKRDAYDGDSNTASPYDAMEQHQYLKKYDEDFGNPLAGFEGAQISSMAQRRRYKNKRDAYDGDSNTVSPYDAMEHHHYLKKYDEDFGNPLSGFEGAQISAMAQRRTLKNRKDAYDGDANTVSPYDAMEHHQYLKRYDEDFGKPFADFEGA